MAEDEVSRTRLLDRIKRDCGPIVLGALDDPAVVEVIRNADGKIWLDVAGKGLVDTGHTLAATSAESLLNVTATLLQTTITRENPILEGEFPLDKSRLAAALPPIVATPTINIRKKATRIFTFADYVAKGMMTDSQRVVLDEATASHRNILIVGGTSSGKTTLANAVMASINDQTPDDRIIAIEDTMELQIPVANHVLLRTNESMNIQRCLRLTMRKRPDRIIVGEVRGAEAHTLLKAWNSGHPGGLATIHADSAAEGLDKLTEYVFEAPAAQAQSEQRIGRVIASAVHMVVFIAKDKLAPGGRAVKEIARVSGFESGRYVLEPVL